MLGRSRLLAVSGYREAPKRSPDPRQHSLRRYSPKSPPGPEVAAFVGPQVVVAPGVDRALAAGTPSGAGLENAGGPLRRKVKREEKAIPLKAGERWKRRLPPVCR